MQVKHRPAGAHRLGGQLQPVQDQVRRVAQQRLVLRAERLAQIKEAIENGAYDTDEKLEAALLRMFDSLGIDLGDD